MKKKKKLKLQLQKVEKLEDLMNDLCPKIFCCENPDYSTEWKCFGRYVACSYYQKYIKGKDLN